MLPRLNRFLSQFTKRRSQLPFETFSLKVTPLSGRLSSAMYSSASKSEIESKYYSKLKSLEGSYTGELEGIVANMMYAKKNITDEALLSSTLEAYKEEIFALEAQSDNKVYAALYDMQNELEKQDLDVSVVQQYRDEYNDIKLQKQQEYLERLGY